MEIPSADHRRIAARQAFENGDNQAALSEIRALLQEAPGELNDLLFFAELMSYEGENDELVSTVSLAISQRPEPKLLMFRGRWHRDRVSETPHPSSAAEGLKWLSSPAGQQHSAVCIERALDDFGRALAINKRMAWQFERADCLLEAGRWEEAELAYQQLIERLQQSGEQGDRLERAESGLESAQAKGEGDDQDSEALLASMDEALASLRDLFGPGEADDEVVEELEHLRQAYSEVVEEEKEGQAELEENPGELDQQAALIAQQLAAQHEDIPERFAEFDPAEIDPPTAVWLDRAQAGLERAGFRCLGTVEPMRNTEVSGRRVPLRLMISADGSALAAIWRLQGPASAFEVVDIESELRDGRLLISNNSGAANPFQPPPRIEQLSLPLGTDPMAVYRAHQQRLAASGSPSIGLTNLDDILALQERIRQIKREHARSQGWVAEADLRGLLGASYRLLGSKVREQLSRLLE